MTNALDTSIARVVRKLDEHKKDALPMNLALESLVSYASQRRTEFPDTPLRELADSIKEIGVVEPLLVRPLGSGLYEIIAGERRWRAAGMAGLAMVPVLVRAFDDETAYKVHLAENIHRENLSTLDLVRSVQRDLDAAGGDLAAVAKIYNKQKPWVSKMSSIANGGDEMVRLVEEGVTADRAVLNAVASLERKEPESAKTLGEKLRAAPVKANKRAITEKFMQDLRAGTESTKAGLKTDKANAAVAPETLSDSGEPAWRRKREMKRTIGQSLLMVELSPLSRWASEFIKLSKKHGRAYLATEVRHPTSEYVFVQFGSSDANRRVYPARELRLLSFT